MKHQISLVLLFLIVHCMQSISHAPAIQKPRVSIITSLYNGDEFIAGFLADQVQQTIFDQCELIIINANSPGTEEAIIKEYMQRYPNIIYIKLDHDPGLYAVWNMAIRMARADLITNANVDDRRNPRILEMHAAALEQDAAIDLVYSEYRVTNTPNESYARNASHYYVMPHEFSPNLMYKCLPGPQPMWRKSLHAAYGYFDESFKSAGDFEMWNRAVSKGARFKRVPGESGLFYVNPRGLSTDVTKKEMQDAEVRRVTEVYNRMWNTQFQYFCTAADSNFFQTVLNLIGSIHSTHHEELGGIAVFDLGLTPEQRTYLATIDKVSVHTIEHTHKDLLRYVKADTNGRSVQGWGAWRFVAIKQALELFPYVLWLDPDFTVLQSLRPLFTYIQESGYFLCTIGDEKIDNHCMHPIKWGATDYVQKAFNLYAHTYVLDKEPVLSGVIGASRQAFEFLVNPLYMLTRNLRLFEDDGTAMHGFGSGRSEETILSVFAYLHGLTVHQQDYTQQIPIMLRTAGANHELYLTWNKQNIREKTALYHSRNDLSNYTRYANAIRRITPLPDTSSSKRTKIVGLVPGRNEAPFLYQHLKALSLYVDAIVYLDDASTDNSIHVVESIAAECKVERIIKKDRWIRDEPGDRNTLLSAGRAIGGTHFVVVDADEMFTANCLDNTVLRNTILALNPGDKLCLVWIQLWRGIDQYRFDDSVWTWNYKDVIFCDDGQCSYSSGFLHTSRSPGNLSGTTKLIQGYDHGLLHFQFVNWRNLLIKQAWYRCLEHIRNPSKSITDINALYAPSKNETNLKTSPSPAAWFDNYSSFFNPALYGNAEGWREKEILTWFSQYGKKFFESLDIWDVDWGAVGGGEE